MRCYIVDEGFHAMPELGTRDDLVYQSHEDLRRVAVAERDPFIHIQP